MYIQQFKYDIVRSQSYRRGLVPQHYCHEEKGASIDSEGLSEFPRLACGSVHPVLGSEDSRRQDLVKQKHLAKPNSHRVT